MRSVFCGGGKTTHSPLCPLGSLGLALRSARLVLLFLLGAEWSARHITITSTSTSTSTADTLVPTHVMTHSSVQPALALGLCESFFSCENISFDNLQHVRIDRAQHIRANPDRTGRTRDQRDLSIPRRVFVQCFAIGRYLAEGQCR